MTGFGSEASGHAKHLLKTSSSKVAHGANKKQILFETRKKATAHGYSVEQAESFQIIVCPSCVREHAAQRAYGKSVTQRMIGYHHAPAVGASVNPMTSADALKNKSRQPLGRAPVAEPRCREAFVSYIDNDSGLRQFDRALIDGNSFTGFDEVLNIQIYSLADVRKGLRIGVPPSVTTFESRTERMPRLATILEFIRLNGDLENIGFHKTSHGQISLRRESWRIIS
jgi:hypothetical protein